MIEEGVRAGLRGGGRREGGVGVREFLSQSDEGQRYEKQQDGTV
jgi:hypothetical protein